MLKLVELYPTSVALQKLLVFVLLPCGEWKLNKANLLHLLKAKPIQFSFCLLKIKNVRLDSYCETTEVL